MSDSAFDHYNPNGVGANNGNFLGLPIVGQPDIQCIAVPFGVTVSYGGGTEGGPANVLEASRQLDVSLRGIKEPWRTTFGWQTLDLGLSPDEMAKARASAEMLASNLEEGLIPEQHLIDTINAASEKMLGAVELAVSQALEREAFPVLVGGEHAVSLGAFRACAKTRGSFGILQVDAHMDLRIDFEGLRYSHASVMHNALSELEAIETIVQVGIRDWCPEEEIRVPDEGGRLKVYYDQQIQWAVLSGRTYRDIVHQIIAELPDRVWISFDIDGLDPSLCANTGTPVAGGLSFAQAQFLLHELIASGRQIIGMDIVEVAPAPYEYEGSVAARLLYETSVRALASRQ